MTVNTNNGYHPEPQPQAVSARFNGCIVRGPDGTPWGALEFAVGICKYQIAMSEADLRNFAEGVPAVLAELLDGIRLERLAAAGLALPTLPEIPKDLRG